MIEEWRTVTNFPDYAVSNLGRIKRLTEVKGTYAGRILAKNRKSEHGYPTAVLRDANGVPRTLQVARLVAGAFLPNPKKKPEVNHKDGIKVNNRPSNLEWVTRAEQVEHAVRTKLMARGSSASRAKLHERNIPVIRGLRAKGHTFQSIAHRFGVAPQTIMSITSGETWRHV